MKNYLSLLLLLCLNINSAIAAITWSTNPIIFTQSIPANNSYISSFDSFVLQFDLTPAEAIYKIENMANLGIGNCKSMSSAIATLYEGDAETGTILDTYNSNIIYGNSPAFKIGNTFAITFPKALELNAALKPGQKYTIKIADRSLSAALQGEKNTANMAATALASPIILTFYGAKAEGLVLDSYTPATETPVETLDKLSLKFNSNISINTTGLQASIYEGENLIKSAALVLNPDDATAAYADFDNEKLYNGHAYKVVIPENSVFPVDPDSQTPLTDKGNKEITLNYKGADYHYDIQARMTPRGEVSYLSAVNASFSFPDGYNLGRSVPSATLYKGDKETGEIVGTYQSMVSSDLKTASFPVWKFDMEANTTYTFVIGAKQIKPISNDLSQVLEDVTNPDIIVTYTTPATLEPVEKLAFQSSNPADKAEIEKLEEISLIFTPYEFEFNKYNPVIADAEAKAALVEVTDGKETELQKIALTLSGSQQEGYSAKGTVGRTLYEGKTYKLRVPAGYFRPSETRLPDYTANDEYVLTLTGKASRYVLAGTSSVAADENLPSVGVAAFYFEGEVAPVSGAKAAIYKGDEETALKETPIFTANGTVYADFSGESHMPYTLEAGITYRLALPQGSVTSQADAEMMNQAVSVTFNGPAVTEYVNVSYITDNAATQTKVVKGNTATCTFTPEPKWEVKSLLFNGEEVKESITAGVYTTPALDADATLKVVLDYTGSTYTEGPGSGVITPEGTSLKAYSSDGNIVIEGLTANTDAVTVYSTGGSVLQHFTATNAAATITLPAGTWYLVRVNQVMMKILNK